MSNARQVPSQTFSNFAGEVIINEETERASINNCTTTKPLVYGENLNSLFLSDCAWEEVVIEPNIDVSFIHSWPNLKRVVVHEGAQNIFLNGEKIGVGIKEVNHPDTDEAES